MGNVICINCAIPLTDEEAYYYECRCEDCERQWMEDIDDWLAGEQNEIFDMMYGVYEHI